jgi:hypothetical protein
VLLAFASQVFVSDRTVEEEFRKLDIRERLIEGSCAADANVIGWIPVRPEDSQGRWCTTISASSPITPWVLSTVSLPAVPRLIHGGCRRGLVLNDGFASRAKDGAGRVTGAGVGSRVPRKA